MEIYSSGQAQDYAFKIKFLNSNKGFLAGYDSSSYNFWVTKDGGKSGKESANL